MDNFHPGNTVQFTWVSSVAPDAEPTLVITGLNDTVIASLTSIQSDSTHYYALYTIPTSIGVYMGEWQANKTVVSSVYPFNKSFLFRSNPTRRSV